MSNLSKGKKMYLFNIAGILTNWIPDKLWLKIVYRLKKGYWMDFGNPQTFNEKIQWLKVNDFKNEYTAMVDKYAVKEIVAQKIGSEYVIPTYGVWDKPEDVDFDLLPNKFVLKTTNGGGAMGVWICKNKALFDKERVICELQEKYPNLGKPHKSRVNVFREHPYDNIKGKIIAEMLLEDNISTDLMDYKFFCFNGKPLYCQVIRDRSTKETIDFYDMNWIHQEFVGLNPKCKNGKSDVPKPQSLGKMLNICESLSDGLKFCRIDLYEVCGKVYFGEITFYPASGFGRFEPIEWERKLGDLISL